MNCPRGGSDYIVKHGISLSRGVAPPQTKIQMQRM
jgi:hypothetical protein